MVGHLTRLNSYVARLHVHLFRSFHSLDGRYSSALSDLSWFVGSLEHQVALCHSCVDYVGDEQLRLCVTCECT